LNKKAIDPGAMVRQVNQHLGWLEHTAVSESAKKLTVSASEGIVEHVRALRDIFTDLNLEAARLGCKAQVTQEHLKSILDTFGKALSEKTVEIEKLKKENAELRAATSARPAKDVGKEKSTESKSYAQAVVHTLPIVKQSNAPKKKN